MTRNTHYTITPVATPLDCVLSNGIRFVTMRYVEDGLLLVLSERGVMESMNLAETTINAESEMGTKMDDSERLRESTCDVWWIELSNTDGLDG